MQAFEDSGDPNEQFDIGTPTSCMFFRKEHALPPPQPKGVRAKMVYKYNAEDEIRKYSSLFKMKINPENLEVIILEMEKYKNTGINYFD